MAKKSKRTAGTLVLNKVGRVSADSVLKGTGKNWDEWIALLKKVGAGSWSRQEIVAFVKKKYNLTPWWQQGVVHGFEVAVGRRIDGQNIKGHYMVTATKSLPFDHQKLWTLVMSKAGMAIWLKPLFPVRIKVGNHFETTDSFFGEIRTLKVSRHVRIRWQDPNWEKPTVVQLFCVERKNGNAIFGINHDGLVDTKIQAQMRKRWKSVMTDFADLAKSKIN